MAENKIGRVVAFEIDASKLDAAGHQMIGKIQTLVGWAQQLSAFTKQTDNIIERVTLTEIGKALMEDVEATKQRLVEHAGMIGAIAQPTEMASEETAEHLPKH